MTIDRTGYATSVHFGCAASSYFGASACRRPCSRSNAAFTVLVYEVAARTVSVHPGTQIV
jgi:hypothetical protein